MSDYKLDLLEHYRVLSVIAFDYLSARLPFIGARTF